MGNQGSSAHEPFDRAQAAANADLKMVQSFDYASFTIHYST